MPIQLTLEQEQKLNAVVSMGAYQSTEEALNAALAVVGEVCENDFEGSETELDELLLEGLNSGEPIVADVHFWNRLRNETDQMVSDYHAQKL